MQDLQDPGAPGTARQGRTGTSVPTDSGGVATQPRAPSHERPLAAQRAAGHGWLSAALEAPGDDEPLTTTARAPGHDCLSAVPRTPGHGRPLAAQRAAGRDRLRVAFGAPGDDVPLATTAGAPGHDRLSAVLIATVPLPAGVSRLRQVILPRVPANPRTLTYSQSHQDTAKYRATNSQAPTYPQSRSTASSFPRKRESINRPSQAGSAGATAPTARSTTHQVHPAVQVPPRPRSCSTAGAGFSPQPHPRAPPHPPPKTYPWQAIPPLHHGREGTGG